MKSIKQRRRKYNNQTECYKIDIFLNGMYACSTDQSKYCKEAKAKFAARHVLKPYDKLTAFFDRD